MFVSVGDAAVVLFFEFVLFGVREWVAPQPELLDELFALFVGVQPLESLILLIRNDVDDVFVQPFLIRRLQFLLEPVLPFLRSFSVMGLATVASFRLAPPLAPESCAATGSVRQPNVVAKIRMDLSRIAVTPIVRFYSSAETAAMG